MTRLGDFSGESLAVDSIADDIKLLENLAARGGSLSEYDLKLLVQCNVRLARLLQVMADGQTPVEPLSPPSRERPARLRSDRRPLMKHNVNSL